MIAKQELHCHACDRYVQFEVDITLDGNYTIPCPNCGHEHYRVIEDGRITDRRWMSSSSITVTWATSSITSIDSSISGTTSNYFYFSSSSGT